MDWDLAIEKNRAALMRVLAMLVAMAGLAGGEAFTSPLRGGRRSSDRRVGVIAAPQPPPDASRRPPLKGGVEPALTLPRHLHRAILRLLRAAESAVRRLVIVMARGVTLQPPRRRAAPAGPAFLDKPGSTGLYAPQSAGVSGFLPLVPRRGGRNATRAFALPLLEPLRPFRPHRPPSSGMPRICVPGVSAPAPLRPPPAPDDPLDATRLALRLRALGAALDDLPAQARRFARWRRAMFGWCRRTSARRM